MTIVILARGYGTNRKLKIKLCSGRNVSAISTINLYSNFESDYVKKTGIVSMPNANETLLGGHAVVCVGYNDNKKVWIMRNSWGINWGDKGYFYLPYEYITDPNLSSDFCSISFTYSVGQKNNEKQLWTLPLFF